VAQLQQKMRPRVRAVCRELFAGTARRLHTISHTISRTTRFRYTYQTVILHCNPRNCHTNSNPSFKHTYAENNPAARSARRASTHSRCPMSPLKALHVRTLPAQLDMLTRHSESKSCQHSLHWETEAAPTPCIHSLLEQRVTPPLPSCTPPGQ
jgi:hypothetical protein